MALQGNLEDLPLLDIIQIVSFSKKTGYLHVRMEGGDGAIVFREGLVVSAFTANSPAADPRLTAVSLGPGGSVARRGSAAGEFAVNAETTSPSRNTIAPSPPSILTWR